MVIKSSSSKASVPQLAEQAQSLCESLERGQANKPLTEALQLLRETGDGPLVVSILCLDATARATMTAQAANIAGENRVACRLADCDQLLADITAYQHFWRAAHALLIVGSPDSALDHRHLEVVYAASQLFPLVWPIVLGSQYQPVVWLSAVHCDARAARLEPMNHDADLQPSPVAWPERLQSFREPLFVQQRSTILSALLEKLAARAEQELAYLALAQSRLELPAKSSPPRGAADSDKELAPLRERLAEQSAAIDRQLTLKSERSTQPLGELSGMIRAICNSINIEDLEESRSSALLKLSINGSHLAHINRRIEHALRQEFVHDLQHVQRQMRQATDESLGALCARFATGLQVNLPVLDVNHAWRSVENLMAIGKETHIELARKGFFDILTAGRQKVFIIIMFASLMGRMGLPNLFTTPGSKAAFGLFMAAVMIGSMVSAVLHWRREKQLTSEKELNKIRDSLLAEGSKVIDQVERAKLATMREYLKEAARTFDCTVKQSLDESLAQQRAKREAEWQKQETLRKSLDLRLKQVVDVQRQTAKLLEQARALAASTLGRIHELSARLPTTPSAPVALAQRSEHRLVPIAAVVEPTAEVQANAPLEPAAQRPARPARAALASHRSRGASALAERRQRRELAGGRARDN